MVIARLSEKQDAARTGSVSMRTLAVIVLFATMASGAVASDDKPNWHVDLVLANLKHHKYRLPAGDFLVLALQPMGTVSTTVVYELGAGKMVKVPGTHQNMPIVRATLAAEKISLLRELVSMNSIQSLPRDSGQVGLDGTALVAVIKVGQKTKFIGHWGAPSPAIELLYALHARELKY